MTLTPHNCPPWETWFACQKPSEQSPSGWHGGLRMQMCLFHNLRHTEPSLWDSERWQDEGTEGVQGCKINRL